MPLLPVAQLLLSTAQRRRQTPVCLRFGSLAPQLVDLGPGPGQLGADQDGRRRRRRLRRHGRLRRSHRPRRRLRLTSAAARGGAPSGRCRRGKQLAQLRERGHVLQGQRHQRPEGARQVGQGVVRAVLQAGEGRRPFRVGEVVPSEQEALVPSVQAPPQERVEGEGQKRRVDDPACEVVEVRAVVVRCAAGVLIVAVAALAAGSARQRGHVHAVVVDEAQVPAGVHEDVAVLQVAMGDP